MMRHKNEAGNYGEYLHQYGLKSTWPRNHVLRILINHHGVLTAEDIYRKLADENCCINFSTVYRILEMFTEKGLVEKSFLPDARKYGFALRSLGHTHRLICLRCHRIVEISHCPLSVFEQKLEGETDFQIVGHNLELYGYCPECKKAMHGSQEVKAGEEKKT